LFYIFEIINLENLINRSPIMKKIQTAKITFAVIICVIIAACSSAKKSSASSTPASTNTTTKSSPFLLKPVEGINAPGNEELVAIQTQYKDVTLEKLKKGHAIYSEGACTKCHDAKSTYEIDPSQWKSILEEMAQKAMISDEEKDAVNKYVLAMKATQPK
jgi:hypothetical protein